MVLVFVLLMMICGGIIGWGTSSEAASADMDTGKVAASAEDIAGIEAADTA